MSTVRPAYRRVLLVVTVVLIVKVTAAVVWGYRDYLPPDFNADFLRGRESYFFDGYQWPFYAHIVSGPVTLLAGLLLISDRFRSWRPVWHRRLGRIQVATVLLLVAPSGLWMAFYAMSGPIAGWSFATLAIATATCVVLGWRSAVKRRFAIHRRWMMRTFLLLCSAVTLRLAGGLATVIEVQSEWFDPIAAWACWAVPLGTYEVIVRRKTRAVPSRRRIAIPRLAATIGSAPAGRGSTHTSDHNDSGSTVSPASAEISARR